MRQHFAGHSVAAVWGQRRDRVLANPAAGADWTFTLPGGHWYRLVLVSWVAKMSAQVATRTASFQIKDGDGNIRLQIADIVELKASQTWQVSGGPELTTAASEAGFAITIALPDMLIEEGWSIGSLTNKIQTEDQISAVRLLLEELVDDYPNEAAGVHLREHHHPAAVGA